MHWGSKLHPSFQPRANIVALQSHGKGRSDGGAATEGFDATDFSIY